VSDLSRVMDDHKIVLTSGAPDYYAIRQIEKEIYEAPITEYPGEWDDLTIEDHYDRRHFRYGLTGHERCMWCEDMRRKSKIIQTEVRAEMDLAARPDRRRRLPRVTPLGVMIAGSVIVMALIVVGVIWG
jgi:hypothetical protein